MDDDALARVRNHEIGFVFQQFNLLPRLTALENVALPCNMRAWTKRSASRERGGSYGFCTIAEPRMHHKPNRLSGGQKQRVAECTKYRQQSLNHFG